MSEQDRRATVAMALYGQDDPDRVVAAGLHGLGGLLLPVRIDQLGACRFRVAAGAAEEVVDFTRISSIRQREIQDPAAGIVRTLSDKTAAHGSRRLTLTLLGGAEDAVCNAQQCVGFRVFALADPSRRLRAQTRAWELVHGCSSAGMADQPSPSGP